MWEIERNLKDDIFIRIELKSKKEDCRHLYLSFTYLKKEKDGDFIWEKVNVRDSKNFTIDLCKTPKCSTKIFNEFCDKLQKNQKELLDMYQDVINGKQYYINEFIEVFSK